jgi:hypothetical protein
VRYETDVKAGKYLVIAHGTAAEVDKAKDVLSKQKPSGVTDHVLVQKNKGETK